MANGRYSKTLAGNPYCTAMHPRRISCKAAPCGRSSRRFRLKAYRSMCRGTKAGLVRSRLNSRLGDLAGPVLPAYQIAPRSSPKTAYWNPGTFAKRGLRAVRQMSQEYGIAHHLGALTAFSCPSFAAPLLLITVPISRTVLKEPAKTRRPTSKAVYDAPGDEPAQPVALANPAICCHW
jgi:hypothetical protein